MQIGALVRGTMVKRFMLMVWAGGDRDDSLPKFCSPRESSTNGIQTVMAGASGRDLFDFAQEMAPGSSFKAEDPERRNE
jgi:hypothetical protein